MVMPGTSVQISMPPVVQCPARRPRCIGAATAEGGGATTPSAPMKPQTRAVTRSNGPTACWQRARVAAIHGGLKQSWSRCSKLARILPLALTPLVQEFGEEIGGHQLAAGDEDGEFGVGVLTGLTGHGANRRRAGHGWRARSRRLAAPARPEWPAGCRQDWQAGHPSGFVQFTRARLTSRKQDAGAGAQHHHRVAGLASTTSAQWFMAAALATLVPPNLATLIVGSLQFCLKAENPVSSGNREEEAKMAGKREDPGGQKHST